MQIARPFVSLLAAILGSISSFAATPSEGHLDFQVIHFGGPISARPSYMAIRNRAEWIALWNSPLDPAMSPPSARGAGVAPTLPRSSPPEVDFDKFTLLVVTSGKKPTLGYAVLFEDIFEFPNELKVDVLDLGPRGCVTGQLLSYPSAMVLIPRTTKPIRFQPRVAYVDCEQSIAAPPVIEP
jgi:hypothetical protein